VGAWLLLAAGGFSPPLLGQDVIRLTVPEREVASRGAQPREPRRGFDYSTFEARLESLWFQRKTLLGNGREEDSRAQLEQLRLFCAEEGVRRLEHLAGALVAEAHRFHEEGSHVHALEALAYAHAFDPGRPQIHMARAVVLWRSGAGPLPAAREMVRALGASLSRSLRDLSLLPRVAFVAGLAAVLLAAAFAGLMLLRYQAPFRHDIDEWLASRYGPPWPDLAGWVALALPLLAWVGAGWVVLYWLAAVFRYMTRGEKLAAASVAFSAVLAVPALNVSAGLYGMSANPAARTTVMALGGQYDPDHIVRLRRLVEAHPDDPTYHFLLAGLYKNGRYFEEAYDEYRAVMEIDPAFVPAHINVGNIFYATGQYAVAMTHYRNALALDPASFLAYFNLHVAQSEDFHFGQAEESLRRAREIDETRVARLMEHANGVDKRSAVEDASLELASVWQAAVEGEAESGSVREAGLSALVGAGQFFNVFGIAGLLTLLACAASALLFTRAPARRCIRCGRSYCERCRGAGQGQEYCSQCLHLYVLRDGLASETKAKKLYEIRRIDRRTRLARRLLSLLLPGAAHVLRDRPARGLALLLGWFALLISAFPEWIGFGSGLHLSPDLLLSAEVPTRFDPHPGRYVALSGLCLLWLLANWRVWRAREA